MILNTNASLKALASGLYPTKKSITPFIIQLELLSPGWTLALINIPFFALAFSLFGSLSLLVIERYSILFPASVLVNVDL